MYAVVILLTFAVAWLYGCLIGWALMTTLLGTM